MKRIILLYIAVTTALISCALEVDADGKVFPPERSCADTVTCVEQNASPINECEATADPGSCLVQHEHVGTFDCFPVTPDEGDEDEDELKAFMNACLNSYKPSGATLTEKLVTCLSSGDKDLLSFTCHNE